MTKISINLKAPMENWFSFDRNEPTLNHQGKVNNNVIVESEHGKKNNRINFGSNIIGQNHQVNIHCVQIHKKLS